MAHFNLQGAIFVGTADLTMYTCSSYYVFAYCNAFRKFLLLLSTLSLGAYHKEIHYSDHTYHKKQGEIAATRLLCLQ